MPGFVGGQFQAGILSKTLYTSDKFRDVTGAGHGFLQTCGDVPGVFDTRREIAKACGGAARWSVGGVEFLE